MVDSKVEENWWDCDAEGRGTGGPDEGEDEPPTEVAVCRPSDSVEGCANSLP